MRKLALLLPFLMLGGAALADGPWDAAFDPAGTITSTAPASANLAVPAGSYLKVQCDVAAHLGQGTGSGTACTASTCEKVPAGRPWFVRLRSQQTHVAALAVSGTATCIVLRATGH